MVYDFIHKGITHEIFMYLSQVEARTPNVRLDLQDHIENIEYRWVSMANLENYIGRTTTNLRKMYDELAVLDKIFETDELYQLKMKKKT